MKALVTADLHLTARPDDEYRWGIFSFLAQRAEHYNVDYILILGDLTDRKDEHPAPLVNRLVNELESLGRPVIVLSGNHDYIDPKKPFFHFLNSTERVKFVHRRTDWELQGERVLLLPHARRWKTNLMKHPKRYKGEEKQFIDLTKYDLVCFHQAVRGARAANGQRVDGMPAAALAPARIALGGDIHLPQTLLPNLHYVGAPHAITFGDTFDPRVILYHGGRIESIPRYTLKKWVVKIAEPKGILDQGLSEGDWVRVILRVPRARLSEWSSLRDEVGVYAKGLKVWVCGVELKVVEPKNAGKDMIGAKVSVTDHRQTLLRFAESRGLGPEDVKLGLELLRKD